MNAELIAFGFIFNLIFYSIFALVYFVVQKRENKRVRPKTIMIWGTLFVVFSVIMISESKGYPDAEETTYMILGALVIIALLGFWEFRSPDKEEEPPAMVARPKHQKIIELLKFGIGHSNIKTRITTLFVIVWILFWIRSLYSAILNGSLGFSFIQISTSLIIVSVLLIFAPFIILRWYLESKMSAASEPWEGIGKTKPTEKVEAMPEPPEPEEAAKKESWRKSGPMKSCPYCSGKISELNFYKLKSGNDVTCEYCGEIISS